MRNIITLVVTMLSLNIVAQQDPEAKIILDRVSEKINTYETITAEFEFEIENRLENVKSKSSGKIYIKGDKYKLDSEGTTVYYDGKTMWSYMEDIKEVTITESNAEDADFVDNPAKIFTFYSTDFKYMLKGEAKVDDKWTYEIDLFPNDLNQPYSRYKIFIDKSNDLLYHISAIGKEGYNYSATINKADFNKQMEDSKFTFDPKTVEGIEVVDMRF